MAEGQNFQKTRQLSDLFGIGVDKQYQTVSSKVTIPALAVGDLTVPQHDLFGQPVKLVTGDWTFVLAGDEAATEGLLYQGNGFVELAALEETPDENAILIRGPGIVKLLGFPAADIEGAAFTPANFEAALLALNPPIVTIDDSGAISEEAIL